MLAFSIFQVSSQLSSYFEEGASLSSSDSLKIEGGYPLQGSIKIDGAKNSVLQLMAATLLTDESLLLTNVPDIMDVHHMLELLKILGVEGEVTNNKLLGSRTLQLCFKGNGSYIKTALQSYKYVRKVLEISKRFRASYFVLGPLVGRFGFGILAHPGGCDLGSRPTNFHVDVMRAFGASVKANESFLTIILPQQTIENGVAVHHAFPKLSVGATTNAILTAVIREKKKTYLSNCAVEPEILDLCICLRKMGAKIDIRSREIEITGVQSLQGTTYRVIPDRIEAGTFMIATAATMGNVTLENIENSYQLVGHLGDLLSKAGCIVTYGNNYVQVNHSCDTAALPAKRMISEIQTQKYPGFPTDLLSPMLALLSGWDGITNCRLVENIWDDRFKTVPELQKMGAHINIMSSMEVMIKRGKKLHGATVVARNLRCAAALCIAGLSAAKGEVTLVKDVYHLDRGYTAFEEKLRKCGAHIERIRSDIAGHTAATTCSSPLLSNSYVQ